MSLKLPLECPRGEGNPQQTDVSLGPLGRFEALRANHLNLVKIGDFLRIGLRESICANRPDSRCESLREK